MPEFMVKVVLSDEQAAKAQDLGGVFKISAEDVLAAAVVVGLNDWEAMDGQLSVHPPGRSGGNDLQLPRGWRRVRASLDLNKDQAARLDETAEWFDLELTEFLGDCLQSGIAHAQSRMLQEHEEAMKGEDLSDDDDLPF